MRKLTSTWSWALAIAASLSLGGCFFMDIDTRNIPRVPVASIVGTDGQSPSDRFAAGKPVMLSASASYMGEPLQVSWTASRGQVTPAEVKSYESRGVWQDGGPNAGKPGYVEIQATVQGSGKTVATKAYLEIEANGEVVVHDAPPVPGPSPAASSLVN
jgi:hypothetical protein